jgi:hypothetical protein
MYFNGKYDVSSIEEYLKWAKSTMLHSNFYAIDMDDVDIVLDILGWT